MEPSPKEVRDSILVTNSGAEGEGERPIGNQLKFLSFSSSFLLKSLLEQLGFDHKNIFFGIFNKRGMGVGWYHRALTLSAEYTHIPESQPALIWFAYSQN